MLLHKIEPIWFGSADGVNDGSIDSSFSFVNANRVYFLLSTSENYYGKPVISSVVDNKGMISALYACGYTDLNQHVGIQRPAFY